MNPFPPPRAYVDWTVPTRKDGTPIDSTRDAADYEAYISWLADYLFTKDIPLPNCQKGVMDDMLSLAEELSITPNPYRPLLAQQLKRIHRHEDRVAALRAYFSRISENLMK